MFVSRSIHTNHADLIHDVAYDFYGRRMATCSSDQAIKIWDLRANGEWVCTARWRCHLGSAWRVTWAHPEFGQVIATCSFDRTIAIWEEIAGAQPTGPPALHDTDGQTTAATGQTTAVHATSTGATPISTTTSWVRRASLVDPRTSVTGLQFAPRHLGLQLAAISTDGMLRIYEAMDVMNLSQWRVQFDFGTKMTGSCLAWSQSRLDPPLIAVGSAAPSGPHQSVANPSDTMSTSVNAGSASGPQNQVAVGATGGTGGSLVSGKVVIYEYSEGRRHWDLVEDIRALDDAVYDMQFAPHMGQSYHTLAVASKKVYILRIRPCNISGGNSSGKVDNNLTRSNSTLARSPYEINLMAHFDHHKGRVWRVSWNVTGSLLASSGDDGCVRLWQANYLGVWLPISVIAPDGSHSSSVPPPSTSVADALGAKASLASTMPLLAPPVRTFGAGLQSKMDSQHKSEQGKTNSDWQGPGHSSSTGFQKLGSFANSNFPVAWH